jgi:hypothetical protein
MAVFLPGKILRDALRVYCMYASERDVEKLATGFSEWVKEEVSEKDVYFMGYHVVAQTRISNPKYAVLEREAKFAVPKDVWRTYTDRVHLVFELRPVVPHRRYVEVRAVARKGFKVSDDKEHRLFCTFGAECDLFALTMEDMHRIYIEKEIRPSIDASGGVNANEGDGCEERRVEEDEDEDGEDYDEPETEAKVLISGANMELVNFQPSK